MSGRYEAAKPSCDTKDGQSVGEPSNFLNVLLQEDGNVRIAGAAFFVTGMCATNNGYAEGTAKLEGNKARYVEDTTNADSCRFTITFSKGDPRHKRRVGAMRRLPRRIHRHL